MKASLLSWPVALPAAVLMHVAVLSLNLGVANGSAGRIEISPVDDTLRINLNDPENEQPEIVRVGAADVFQVNAQEFAAKLAGPIVTLSPTEPQRQEGLERTLDAISEPGRPLVNEVARTAPSGLDADADAPLGAGNVGAGTGSSGTATGSAAGTGEGLSGHIAAGGQGGKDLFSRVANQMVGEHQRSTFALKGQPSFPRACRQGLCRRGTPCEGNSEWRVSVPAGGGAPTKIEAISQMDCELQNASIRKFFNDYKFPASERARVYIFPVKMRITQ
jgi:hypothetical protein